MVKREYERVVREYEGVKGEYKRASREYVVEMDFRAGAIRRYPVFKTRGYFIYTIYISNLGWGIAILRRKRE